MHCRLIIDSHKAWQSHLCGQVWRQLSIGDCSSQARGAHTWNVAQNGRAVLGGFRQAAVVLYAWSMVCVWVPSMLPLSPISMCVGAQGSRLYLYTLLDLCGQSMASMSALQNGLDREGVGHADATELSDARVRCALSPQHSRPGRMLHLTNPASSDHANNSLECSTRARRYWRLKKSRQGLQIKAAAYARDSIHPPKLSAAALHQHTDLLNFQWHYQLGDSKWSCDIYMTACLPHRHGCDSKQSWCMHMKVCLPRRRGCVLCTPCPLRTGTGSAPPAAGSTPPP